MPKARRVGGRDQGLAAIADRLDQQFAAPLGVELAENVVEQHQRAVAAARRQRVALGEQQRQQAQPLLTLRSVAAQVAAGGRAGADRRDAGRAW